MQSCWRLLINRPLNGLVGRGLEFKFYFERACAAVDADVSFIKEETMGAFWDVYRRFDDDLLPPHYNIGNYINAMMAHEDAREEWLAAPTDWWLVPAAPAAEGEEEEKN